MDCKVIEKSAQTFFRIKTCFKRKWFVPFFLSFVIICLFSTNVFADDNLYSLSFDSSVLDITFGYLDGIQEIKFSEAFSRDISNYNVDVYDVNGNKIQSGTTGTVPMNKDLYPIKFKVTPSGASDDWRIDLAVQAIPSAKPPDPNTGILNNILDKLSKLEDFMDNPKYMQDGLNNLQGAVDKMNSYGPIGAAQSAVGTFNNVSVGSGALPSLNIVFLGKDVNVLDLSAVSGQIAVIKSLMRAILWIGLFIYLIRYFMPRLKI